MRHAERTLRHLFPPSPADVADARLVALLGPHASATLSVEPLRVAGRPLRISWPRARADGGLPDRGGDPGHLGGRRLDGLAICPASADGARAWHDRHLLPVDRLHRPAALLRRPLFGAALQALAHAL